MKIKKILSIMSLIGLVALVSVLVEANKAIVSPDAQNEMYTMTFSNEQNKLLNDLDSIEHRFNYVTDLGNDVDMLAFGLNVLSNGWGTFNGDNGWLQIESPLSNMQSITINTIASTSELELGFSHYGYENNYITLNPVNEVYNYNFTESTNFFYLYFFGEANVDIISMTITYTCASQIADPFLHTWYKSKSNTSGETIELKSNFVAYDYKINDISDRITFEIISGNGTLDGSTFTYGPAGDVTIVKVSLTDSEGRTAKPIDLTLTAT